MTRSKILLISAALTSAVLLAASTPLTSGAEPRSIELAQMAIRPAGNTGPVASRPAEAAPATAPAAIPGEPGEAPKPRKPTDPGNPMERAADSGAQIYVPDSFDSVEKLRHAMRFDQQNQTTLAIQKYQELVDDFGQKLVYLNNDSYVSVTDYVRGRLLTMHAVQKGEYDQLFGIPAQKAVDAALADHDLAALARVCDRYFPSAAAAAGLAQAAEWYFERAEFSAAARTWEMLLTHPRAADRQAEFLHHAIVAEKLAGRDQFAKDLRERLAKDFPDATASISGESANLLANADQILAQQAWEHVSLPVDEWPMFGGSPTQTAVADVNSMAGAELWNFPLDASAVDNTPGAINALPNGGIRIRGPVRFINGQAFAANGMVDDSGDSLASLSSYPVLSGGQLYLHTGDHVVALTSNAGTQLSVYPPDKNSGQPLDPNAAAMAAMYQQNGYRPVAHDSCTVYGDQVFAVLPAAPAPPSANPRMNRFAYYYGPTLPNTRVVALSRNDLKEQWSTSASSVPLDVPGSLSFVGAPIITRQGVFCMAKKTGGDAFTQVYLVRLDRQTGAISYACYICSASSGGYYDYTMSSSTIPLISLADDIVYVSTGQGADCAIDANAGRILWLQITESAKTVKDNNAQQFGQQGFNASPSWKLNSPMVYQDRLITAGSGSAIRFYDRWSGKILTKIDPKTLDDADVIPGIVDSNLITVGKKIHALDLATMKDQWPALALPANDGGRPLGRPFLTQHYLYVPMTKGLFIADIDKGEKVAFNLWPKDSKEQAGRPGNLLVTSEQIILVNDSRVAGYSRWEAARDNRLKIISEHPEMPQPYLDLSEVAYRTGHLDISQDNMTKAVQRAISAPTPNAEFLIRLYRTNLAFANQLLAKAAPAERDVSRFYFQQCKLTARDADAQAEWRLSLAPLALAQSNWDQAAALYSDVLIDPAMRNATFHYAGATSRAAITAESSFRALFAKVGSTSVDASHKTDANYKTLVDAAGRAAVYQTYEAQAAALLAKARTQKDPAAFSTIVEAYPNSLAAIAASTDLAAAYRTAANYPAEAKALRWAYARITNADQKALITARLAVSAAAVKNYNAALAWTERGRRQYPAFVFNDQNQARTFAQLTHDIQVHIPSLINARRPAMMPLPKTADAVPLGHGFLLTPIESDTALRRADILLINDNGKIHMFQGPAYAEKWVAELPDNTPVALLGYAGTSAILATADSAIALDIDSGDIKWVAKFELSEEDRARYQEAVQRIRQVELQQLQMAGNVNIGFADIGYPNNQMQQFGMDPDQLRFAQFQAVLGRPNFSALRIVNNKLVAIVANKMSAYNVDNGKRVWRNPVTLNQPGDQPGAVTSLTGNDELIVVQIDGDAGTPTFDLIETDTGNWHGTIKLNNEHVLWRALGEGCLFIASDSAISAYDLHGDFAHPAWRNDIRIKYPAATILSLDGLVTVNAENELVCLSQEGGEARWKSTRLQLSSANNAMPAAFRISNDGDNVVIQSPTGAQACRTFDGETAWIASPARDQPPILISSQYADPYLILLASGPTATAQRAVSLMFLNRVNPTTGELTNGSIHDVYPIHLLGEPYEGPVIRAWQAVDNAIAIEVVSDVYIYRSEKKP